MTPHDQRNSPYHMVFCSKSSGKGGARENIHDYGFVFPNNCYTRWSLAFLAKHLPAAWKQWMNVLFCFTCTCNICFPYWTHYLLLLYLYFLPDPQQRGVRRLFGYWPESIRHMLSLNMHWEGSLDQEGMHTEANVDLAQWLRHLPCRGNIKWNQTKLNCITPESKKENTGLPAHSLKYEFGGRGHLLMTWFCVSF